jgi:hypothetical protein
LKRPPSTIGTTSSASPDALDVILRDGTTLRLWSPRAEDAAALVEFLNGFSEQSLYYRFHGYPTVTMQLVQPFLEPDWHEAAISSASSAVG